VDLDGSSGAEGFDNQLKRIEIKAATFDRLLRFGWPPVVEAGVF
jgi:hypothetical protein